MAEKKSTSFIVLTKSMIRDLKLKNTELLIYAIIYSFSKENAGKFYGGLNYLMDWTNSSKPTVINSLKVLEENNLIKKEVVQEGRIRYCTYSVIEEDENNSDEVKKSNDEVKNFNDEVKEFNSRGKESLPNNKLYNKYNNKINNTSSSHSESTQHYNSTPTDNPCGSEDSTTVSSSSPEPTPFDEPNPFDEPVSQPVASTHSDKPNEEQKPRKSAKGSYPNEYYKTVLDTYMSNYKTLLDTGKLKTPLPNIAIMSVKGTLKRCFDAYGYETILKAVKESVNDDWLIEHGYVFHHIFGERKLIMLINGIKYETKKTVVTNSLVKQSLESDYDGEW